MTTRPVKPGNREVRLGRLRVVLTHYPMGYFDARIKGRKWIRMSLIRLHRYQPDGTMIAEPDRKRKISGIHLSGPWGSWSAEVPRKVSR